MVPFLIRVGFCMSVLGASDRVPPEGLSLQATNPNAALVLSLFSGCRKRLTSPRWTHCSPGSSLSLPIRQVVLIAGLVAVPFRRQFSERRIKLLRRQRQLGTHQGLECRKA